MNISFDLDGTLIPMVDEFSTESIGWLGYLLKVEKIRKGTKNLFYKLKKEGHTINIYTTSFRSKRKIRRTLFYYGISVKKIVTQAENQNTLRAKGISASKYPPAFSFDIHIDDLEGVGMEGKTLGFKAIIIEPDDNDWSNTVLQKIDTI